MGKTNVYGDRSPFYVPLKIGTDLIYYGFQTNIDAAEGQLLGHTSALAAQPAGGQAVIFGANLPKPTRMKTPNGVTSFVATDSIATAKAAKCKIVKPGKRYRYSAAKSNFAAGGVGSCNLYVPIQGVKYAWKMPRYQVSKIGDADRTGLGIVLPTTDNDARGMIFGASSPIPPRASKSISTTDGDSQTFTTFYDPTKSTLPTGWTAVKSASSSGTVEF